MLARFEQIGADRKNTAHGYQDQVREVMVYEAYNLDVDGTGEAVLHKFVKLAIRFGYRWTGVHLYSSPLPTPHSLWQQLC